MHACTDGQLEINEASGTHNPEGMKMKCCWDLTKAYFCITAPTYMYEHIAFTENNYAPSEKQIHVVVFPVWLPIGQVKFGLCIMEGWSG